MERLLSGILPSWNEMVSCNSERDPKPGIHRSYYPTTDDRVELRTYRYDGLNFHADRMECGKQNTFTPRNNM